MTYTAKKIIIVFSMLVFNLAMGQQSDQIVEDVNQAIQHTNAGKLAKYFNSTIDLEVLETDGTFSKAQAEMILKDFFIHHPKKSYTLKHQGSSDDGSRYVIGSYISTENKEFRIYILFKKPGEKLVITQIQFEED